MLWHWMIDRDNAFQELAKKYTVQTGIKVKIELFAPSDSYSKRIIASAQAGVLPDIYGVLDKKDIFASFIKSGFVADLTFWFEENDGEWKNSLLDKAVDVNRFETDNLYGIKPGIYGVPIDLSNNQMIYNKKLLQRAGIKELPQDFEGFLEVFRALDRVGIPGMVSGWGEMWMINNFASNYAFNIMGQEKVMATYRGEVPYTDPDWIKVFNVFKDLRDSHALMDGIVTKPNKEAEQDFALERVAFAFNGSWCVNVYKEMNPDLEYGVFMPPRVNQELPMKVWGGAGSSFVVNNASNKKEKAVAFLKWLTLPEQQEYLAIMTNNLPANKEALRNVPEILMDFAKAMEETTHPLTWPLNESPIVVEKFDRGIQSIIIGEKEPEQVAREVQAAKQNELQKVNKN